MDSTILDAIGQFVATVGVPAALAIFILWKLNNKLEHLVNNITKLNGFIESLMLILPQKEIVAKLDRLTVQLDIWEERWRNREFSGWKTIKNGTGSD